MNKLFLICPDCYIEQPIRNKFGDNCFFLTALGTVFDLTSFEYLKEINQFVVRENIEQIYLVNDTSCTFIKNAVEGEVKFDTKAEKPLLDIKSSSSELMNLSSNEQKCSKIAELNLKRLRYELTESAFLGQKIEDGEIDLKGLLFDRSSKQLKDLSLDFKSVD
jgi:hypothetical protein